MHALEFKLSCIKNVLWGSLPKLNMWYGFVQVGHSNLVLRDMVLSRKTQSRMEFQGSRAIVKQDKGLISKI